MSDKSVAELVNEPICSVRKAAAAEHVADHEERRAPLGQVGSFITQIELQQNLQAGSMEKHTY